MNILRIAMVMALLAAPAVAEVTNIPAYRLKQIQQVQAETRQELQNRYQQELRNATTPAQRQAVQARYQNLLETNRSTVPSNLPIDQQFKLRANELKYREKQLDYYKKGDISPTVKSLNTEAAYDKGVEEFRDNPNVMREIMRSRKNQLQQAPRK